jgi:hypothetical protein
LRNNAFKVLLLIIFFCLSSSFVATSEENGQKDFIIHGYIKDKSSDPLDETAVSLLVQDTNEELLTLTNQQGYYSFNLKELEKGWNENSTILVLSIYNDYEDDDRYYNGLEFKIDPENNSKYVNLTLGRLGIIKQFVDRSFNRGVNPNKDLSVTLSGDYFGRATLIWETIPNGFEFKNCSLPEYQYEYFSDNHTFMFIITKEEKTFTYNITAPKQEGEYSFDGHFIDFTKNRFDVARDKQVKVYDIDLSIDYEIRKISGYNSSSVTFTAEVTGGEPPYTFWWRDSTEDEYLHMGENTTLIYDKGGDYTMNLKMTDSNGVTSTASTNFTIYTDLEVIYDGTLQVEKNTYNWFNVSSRGGVAPIYYEWDTNNDGIYGDRKGESAQLVFNEVGYNTIAVKAIDSTDPPHEDILTIDINCVDTKVLLDKSTPANNDAEKKVDKIYFLFKEEVTLLESIIDNQEIDFVSADNKSFAYFNSFELGTHEMKIKAEDESGNKKWFNFSFIVDDIPPVLELQDFEKEIKSKTDILVNSYDNDSSIANVIFEISIANEKMLQYNATEQPYILSIDPADFEDRQYSLKITAYDQAGNIKSESIDITIQQQNDNNLMDYLWLIVIIIILAIITIIYISIKKK